MITWDNFYLFAIVAVALWILGAGFALFSNVKSRMAVILSVLGTITLSVFIAGFWISLQRPPLRTMGETRLWYSFFMGVSGLLTYLRWKYRWILAFSTIVGTVFVLLNILKPEIHDQSLMPALQSFWFVPHVTVYMFSYSVLGCAFILSCMGLYRHRENYLEAADNLVYTGVAFFTIGMLTGAILGKSCVGALLELGSQRNLGCFYLGGIFVVYTFAAIPTFVSTYIVLGPDCFFSFSSNVLVWCELSSFCPAKHTFI